MMALPSGVKVTAWQVMLGVDSLSSSFPVLACHTLTSLKLLVANSSLQLLLVVAGLIESAVEMAIVTYRGKQTSVIALQ